MTLLFLGIDYEGNEVEEFETKFIPSHLRRECKIYNKLAGEGNQRMRSCYYCVSTCILVHVCDLCATFIYVLVSCKRLNSICSRLLQFVFFPLGVIIPVPHSV